MPVLFTRLLYNRAVKICLKDLMNIADEKVYPVDIECLNVKDNVFLRRIEDAYGELVFYYDAADTLHVFYDLQGLMVCPDAITLEDVFLPFDLSEDEKVVFKPEEEGFLLDSDRPMEELLEMIVLPEVPIKVVKKEKIEYSRGDGWVFVSEEDYNASKKDEIDPRLQKLKEYRFEEDD